MNQPVLVYTHINKGSEVGDVSDNAFKGHAFNKISNLLNALFEISGFEFGPRVTPRLIKLRQDIRYCRQSKAVIDEGLGIDAFQERRITQQFDQLFFPSFADTLYHRVGLGMHCRGIKRIISADNAQESGGLFETLLAETRHRL